ncbi:MAG: hypothetical protein WC994_11210 [Brumimicrobium sp.]
MFFLSIPGTFRTILIIIAILLLIRFLRNFMNARNAITIEERLKKEKEAFEKEKKIAEQEKGKVRIIQEKKDAEDTDFEEIK